MKKKSCKKKTFAEKAYTGTRVDYGYTQRQITKMLEAIGIDKIRITQEGNDFALEFFAQLRKGEAPRKVKINVPFTPELEDTYQAKQHKKDVLFRVLFHHLKDKFVAINRGLKEFEEEFLSDLMINHNGREVRLGDVLVPKYKKMLEKGDVAVFRIEAEAEVNK